MYFVLFYHEQNKPKTKFRRETSLYILHSGLPSLKRYRSHHSDLEKNGVDLIEIGMPFSDPLADGPTIQESSTIALRNGMTTEILFQQIQEIRKTVAIPLILMAYFNPIFQYGVEEFCKKCAEIGIDGLILPDLPLDVYQEKYEDTFKKYDLINVFLITPQTSDKRIRQIDAASNGFIYMVSSASVTGSKSGFGDTQTEYFKRIAAMNLKNPQIVGFGIKDAETFEQATKHAKGAIIGSAFIKHLTEHGVDSIANFVKQIR